MLVPFHIKKILKIISEKCVKSFRTNIGYLANIVSPNEKWPKDERALKKKLRYFKATKVGEIIKF